MSQKKNMDAERAALQARIAELEAGQDSLRLVRDEYKRKADEYRGKWAALLARASLPVGVPDGWWDAGERRPITWEDPDGEIELQVYDGAAVSTAVFYKRGERAGWKRVGVQGSIQAWRYLAAAPTVKAEQPECGCCGRSDRCDDDCDTRQIPSLPAAGSAVEDGPDITTKNGYPAYSVAQHTRIVAALSAQQSAPEMVSVPVELLERIAGKGCDPDCCIAYWREQLRALLASHAEGGKV